MTRLLRRLVLLGLILYAVAWGYRIVSRKYDIWLAGYGRWLAHRQDPTARPVHIFLLFVDHFEPGQNLAMMDRWVKDYPPIANRHRDSAGRPWQHTWFYPGEQPIDRNLEELRKLTDGGYGEVELHLHHFHDTYESGREKYRRAIAWFQRFGFLETPDGATHFAFIHGNWGLDNSKGEAYCGINLELKLLRELGCFADFTFPAIFEDAQPSTVNSIYEATDDGRPKSYDRGTPLRVGGKPQGDLLIFEGPLLLVPTWNPAKLFVDFENSEIHAADPVTAGRVDAWVRADVHVEGKPDWVFIKIHAHGGTEKADADEIMGPELDRALEYLEKTYNDGAQYVLHYVTAREAFNLARAAADGRSGDPRQYYNYLIPRYGVKP